MGLFDLFKKKDKDSKKSQQEQASKKSAVNETADAKQFYDIKVQKVEQETENAASIYLSIPEKLQATFTYQAGQYITLNYPVGDKKITRSYSLSSSPDTDSFFRIGVKEKKGGAVSGLLLSNTQAGQTLSVFPPLGSFTPDFSKNTKQYILFAGGSGITPMLSIAKSILSKAKSHIHLVYANRNPNSIMYRNELEQLVLRYSERFTIQHILDEGQYNNSITGIFKANDYANYINNKFSDFGQTECYICGPIPMMQAIEEALNQQEGIAAEQVHVEYFDMDMQKKKGTTTTPTTTNSATAIEKKKGDTSATVYLQGTSHNVTIIKGETVLNACLDAGLDAPFMCESGVCTTCRAHLKRGTVNMIASYGLDDNEKAKGYILTCQSLPTSENIEISFD